jgi:hypothetical protein
MKNLFGLFVALLFSVSLSAQHTKGEILFSSDDSGMGLTVGIAETIDNSNSVIKSLHANDVKQFLVFDIVVNQNGKNVSDDYQYSTRIRRYESFLGFRSYKTLYSTNIFIDGSSSPYVKNGKYFIEVFKRDTNEVVYSTRVVIENGEMK